MDAMKQSIGEYVRDNGGNAWVALDHALQKLEAAEAEVAKCRAEVKRLNAIVERHLIPIYRPDGIGIIGYTTH